MINISVPHMNKFNHLLHVRFTFCRASDKTFEHLGNPVHHCVPSRYILLAQIQLPPTETENKCHNSIGTTFAEMLKASLHLTLASRNLQVIPPGIETFNVDWYVHDAWWVWKVMLHEPLRELSWPLFGCRKASLIKFRNNKIVVVTRNSYSR